MTYTITVGEYLKMNLMNKLSPFIAMLLPVPLMWLSLKISEVYASALSVALSVVFLFVLRSFKILKGDFPSFLKKRPLLFSILVFLMFMTLRSIYVIFFDFPAEKVSIIYFLMVFFMVYGISFRESGFSKDDLTLNILLSVFVFLLEFLIYLLSPFIAAFALNLLMPTVFFQDISMLPLTFAFMTLVVGVSEEWLFRGFIQRILSEKFTNGVAITIQAILFGLWHIVWHIGPEGVDIVGMFTHVIFSFIWGILVGIIFIKTGSLLAPILIHGLWDTMVSHLYIRLPVEVMTCLPIRITFASVAGALFLCLLTITAVAVIPRIIDYLWRDQSA